jgi:hypothetical protein
MGLITKGMGAILKHAKKGKKLKTVYRVKPSVNISSYKKSKKHGLAKKLDVWSNREAAIAIEQAGKGVTMKFKKSGMPYVKTGTKPSMLTKAKGYAKLVSPLAAGLTGGAIHGKIKSKK